MDHIKKYMNSVGLDFPTNEQELDLFKTINEKTFASINEEEINPYRIIEKIKASKKKTSKSAFFFKRVVLAAEITYKCHEQRTFGRVKFQKLLFLCENVSEMDLRTHGNYLKQVAGPFDHKFMHTIHNEFEKQRWFDAEKQMENGYTKWRYSPLEKVLEYKKYYNSYFGEIDEKIQKIITIFLNRTTRETELVATIFSCWQEVLQEKSFFSNEIIISKVYSWAKEKEKFSRREIVEKIGWMRGKGIFPRE